MHSSRNAPPVESQPSQSREPQQYVVHHEFGDSAELTTTLVHAISDVTGVDVRELEFTLDDYVDPDALNRLFEPKADGTMRLDGYLGFTVQGCQVTVFSDGHISIVPPRGSGPQ